VQKRRGTSNDTEGAESASTQVAGGGVGSQESGRVGSHSRQGEEEEEEWVDVPFVPGSIVVNLGDALEHLTGGLLRATPHRVRPQRSAQGGVAAPSPARLPGRLSFPFFFDPSFESPMTSLGALFKCTSLQFLMSSIFILSTLVPTNLATYVRTWYLPTYLVPGRYFKYVHSRFSFTFYPLPNQRAPLFHQFLF